MNKIISVVGAVLGALALSTSSLAAGAPAQTTTPRAEHSGAASGFVVPAGGSTVYSNLNSDTTDTYDCCSGWTISTTGSVIGSQQFIATPFTPAASGKLTEIDLGLGWVTGANSVTVVLAADKKGLPGKTITTFTASGLDSFGDCCDLVVDSVKGAKVKAGKQYWVIVSASADTWAVWNQNSTNVSGPFAYDTGTGWQITSGVTGAFAVLGK